MEVGVIMNNTNESLEQKELKGETTIPSPVSNVEEVPTPTMGINDFPSLQEGQVNGNVSTEEVGKFLEGLSPSNSPLEQERPKDINEENFTMNILPEKKKQITN